MTMTMTLTHWPQPVSQRCREIPLAAQATCEPSRRSTLPVSSDQDEDDFLLRLGQ